MGKRLWRGGRRHLECGSGAEAAPAGAKAEVGGRGFAPRLELAMAEAAAAAAAAAAEGEGGEEEAAAAAATTTAAAEEDEDEEALKKLEELVENLYRYRERLAAETGSVAGGEAGSVAGGDAAGSEGCAQTGSGAAEAGRSPGGTGSEDALVEEMERTLKLMEAVPVSGRGRGRAWLLRGRALLASPRGHARAEQALGHALKLEPGLGIGWSRLGELQWQRGDRKGAAHCFRRALQLGQDAEPRRLLSMLLRAGGGGGALRESLAQAEAAVRCEPRDGRNWYVLGNAYVSLFFQSGQSPEWAKKALGAYGQAERVDQSEANNPDLHLNRATLLQYQERFGAALEGLLRASLLAPGWEEPRRRRAQLLDYLRQLCGLLANGVRGAGPWGLSPGGRRRRGQQGPLPPSLLGGCSSKLRPSPLPSLQPGANPGLALLGRVQFSLLPPGGVPYTLGVADGCGGAVAVTVYNAAPDWSVLVGDALGVPEPLLVQHQHQHQGQTFSFRSIRVSSPLSLLVNGRRPPGHALAPARLALTNDPSQ
ncbi:LOW QUALITY PROTEIN: tetratricopeptide repeat protein 5 [Melanerpes formicivorus]|uniref:LOW QUALITY PROTEIN: tetratricopeptide repeat protein 5 n=1 Tax=Melanerpes formicivorus TaxID=211600 RepID=UPI00358F5E3A